jgi:prepilin-type N-terminal cleavage/methylation domain-containing protein
MRRERRAGFTLIELLVVIAIIAARTAAGARSSCG